jgi:hypothetical protein
VHAGQTGQPILTRHASNNAVSPNELPFGVTMTSSFVKRSLSPKVPYFRIGLAESWETHECFRVCRRINRQTTNLFQTTLSATRKITINEKFGELCKEVQKFKKNPLNG